MSDISLKLKEFSVASPKVYGLKIATITLLDDERAVLAPATGSMALIVGENYLKEFSPKVGDWYVVSPQGVETLFDPTIFEDPEFGYKSTAQV